MKTIIEKTKFGKITYLVQNGVYLIKTSQQLFDIFPIRIPLTVRASHNPKDPLTVWAIFDTGADSTCVAHALAKKLELIPRGSIRERGASGAFQNRVWKGLTISLPMNTDHNYPLDFCPEVGFDWNPNINSLTYGNDAMLLGRDMTSLFNFRWSPGDGEFLVSAK